MKIKFCKETTRVIENVKENCAIAGDFNSIMGKKDESTVVVIQKYGEYVRNTKKKVIIDFWHLNNSFITNTFYKHNDEHKYTREVMHMSEKWKVEQIFQTTLWLKQESKVINNNRAIKT